MPQLPERNKIDTKRSKDHRIIRNQVAFNVIITKSQRNKYQKKLLQIFNLVLLSSRPGTWTLKFNVTLHQCVTDGFQVTSWRNKETGGGLVGGQELNSFHANVFQPVSSNQYSHRPHDKIHLHHCLRIITQKTSEFTGSEKQVSMGRIRVPTEIRLWASFVYISHS